MIVSPADAWKLILALALGATIFAGACGTAPRRAVPNSDLRRLVLSALGLYVVGGVATITRHITVAAVLYATGIAACTLALWLSRGTDSGDDPPRGGDEPSDAQPPPSPEGLPEFDWAAFEEQFRSHAQNTSERREAVPS
jgi:hypothetical protein